MTTSELQLAVEKTATSNGLLSREEAMEYGRSLRNKCARTSHSDWNPSSFARPNPVDILEETSRDRDAQLVPIRYGRMLQSPFAFYRGAAAIMAADLNATPSTGIYVQACGDCHLVNFGGYATPERRIVFDINDFDETLPAPWEWDLKRLAASFVIASRHNGMSNGEVREITVTCVESYHEHIVEYSNMSPLQIWYSSITTDDVLKLAKSDDTRKRLTKQLEKAKDKSLSGEGYPKLLRDEDGKIAIADNPPLIFHRKDAEAASYLHRVEEAFQKYAETLGDDKKTLFQQYKFIDLASKVVGVGSVGRLCGISLRMTADEEPLFLQVKEAVNSVLEPYAGKSAYDNSGRRVVQGQKLMQAASDMFLGWGVGAGGRHFYVRQLRDMKIKPMVELFDEDTMLGYARLCGWTLARAHARSGKSALIAGYLGNSAKFAEAVSDFGVSYAEQNEKDFATVKRAVRDGRLEAYFE